MHNIEINAFIADLSKSSIYYMIAASMYENGVTASSFHAGFIQYETKIKHTLSQVYVVNVYNCLRDFDNGTIDPSRVTKIEIK